MKFTLCHHEVQIDGADFGTFLSHVWFIHKTPNNTYLRTKIGGHYVKLQRLLLGVTDRSVKVDHRNGNGLDNRRDNLRACSNAQNSRNRRKMGGSSRFKGVFMDGTTGKWRAEIGIDFKKVNLGRFDDEVAAALAYDIAAAKHHKDFARPNFSISEAALVHPESLRIAIERCRARGILDQALQQAA